MNLDKREKEVRGMRNWLQHNFNSMHIYCRLVRVMPKATARSVASWWEKRSLYRLMYQGA
jgi:hypothetical protein